MLKPYDGYKNVGEVWIEKTPLHWEFKRIKHVLHNRVEKNSPVQTECVLSLSAKNGVELQTEKTDKGGNKPKSDFSKYNLAYEQDLLVNCMNVVSGSSGVSKWYGAISPVYYALHTRNQNSNIRYYHYLFRFKPFYRSLLRFSKGILMHESDNGNLNTVRMRISMESLNNINIPIPPREEQDQIVKYLDWQTSKINTLIKAKKKQIELMKEQKQAVINKAVAKGLDDTVPMKDSGIEWLGEVPKHWDSRFLFQIAKEQGVSNKGMVSDNLLSLSYGKIINKSINKTDGLLPESFETYQIVDNANIILRLTDLQNDHKSLRVGLVTQKGIITSAYTCLNPKKNVFANFLYNLLHSYDICKVFYGMGGGVRQSIGYKDISKIICFCPPLEEQQVIITYLEEKTVLIDNAIAVIEKEIELVSEYKISLISSVVTGKVDVRDVVVPEFQVVEEVVSEDDEGLEVDTDDSN